MGTKIAEKDYKTSYINNRRYLGNKYKLLPFIKGVVERECDDITSLADIFAGTGAVSSAFSISFFNMACGSSPAKHALQQIRSSWYFSSISLSILGL